MSGDAWRLAVGTLTAVPVRPPSGVDLPTARAAMLLAPLAAVPLGVLVAAVGAGGERLGLPPLVVGLLAVGALALATRGLHLDGLSDVADGLAASFDRERALAVMKTGTSGPAGVVATVLVLALQATAFAALMGTWRGALLAGVAVCCSRGALVLCCARGVPAARPDGLGVTFTQTVPRAAAVAVWLVVAVALTALAGWAGPAWWRGAAAAVLSAVVVLALVRHAVRRFGGVTGDVYGASIEAALATVLVALA